MKLSLLESKVLGKVCYSFRRDENKRVENGPTGSYCRADDICSLSGRTQLGENPGALTHTNDSVSRWATDLQ